MTILGKNDPFPKVTHATKEGILAIGGGLSTDRLITAYKNGIFPWYNEYDPIVWYAPPKRMVLFFEDLKISKSMRKVLTQNTFEVTYNQNFKEVISHCKNIYRKGQYGTWITDEMEAAYIKLHEMGYAKSVEVWQNSELVGGLYGVDLGQVFCGESMFSLVSNASKAAFIHLAKKLEKEHYKIIDCQVYNDHLASLGAKEITREAFMEFL